MSRIDFNPYRGDSYEHEITWEHDSAPVDLTGWSGVATVKDRAGSLLATGSVTVTDVAGGVFTVGLSAAQTAGLPASAEWDAQFTHADGRVVTPAFGIVVVSRDVSP